MPEATTTKLNMGASKRKQEKAQSATAHKKLKVSEPKNKSKRSKIYVPRSQVAKSESEDEEGDEADNSDDEEGDEEDDEEEEFGGIEDGDEDEEMNIDDEKSKNSENGTSGCESKSIRLF